MPFKISKQGNEGTDPRVWADQRAFPSGFVYRAGEPARDNGQSGGDL